MARKRVATDISSPLVGIFSAGTFFAVLLTIMLFFMTWEGNVGEILGTLLIISLVIKDFLVNGR